VARPTNAVWDQQSGESGSAFAAWCEYRDLGSERSIEAVARKLAKSGSLLRRWSARWGWVERAARWDGHQDGLRTAATNLALEQAAVNWATEREAERERELELGQALIAKAKTMLQWPLEQRRVIGADGRTTIVEPTKWRLADAAKMVEVGSKLIRLAAEMETDRVSVDHVLRAQAERLSAEYNEPVEQVLAELEAHAQKVLG
jgi:hypothetical protein